METNKQSLTAPELSVELNKILSWEAFQLQLEVEATLNNNFTQRSLIHLCIDLPLFISKYLINGSKEYINAIELLNYFKTLKF